MTTAAAATCGTSETGGDVHAARLETPAKGTTMAASTAGVPAATAQDSVPGQGSPCWLWSGTLDSHGYARFRRAGGGFVRGARAVYELLHGDLADGLVVDHLCHDPRTCTGGISCTHRRCVNPAHLEAVTVRENTLRGGSFAATNAAKTHCIAGHLLDGANVYIRPSRPKERECLTCTRARKAAARARKSKTVPSPAPDLAPLVAAVEDASRAVAGWLDRAQEVDEALDVLATVRAARVAIAQIESVVESRSGRLMSGDVIEWPGGVAERRFGKERKTWRHDDLIHTVTRQIAQSRAADATSGEVDDMLAALLSDALDEFAATHRPDWRVTPLKAMGIDPDEYCHAEPGKVSVRIIAAGEQ